MARIHNTETIKRILDDAKIQTSADDVPQELASKVVPVLISNPERIGKCASATRTVTGSSGVFTSSTTKRTFISSAFLGCMVDVVNDGTIIELEITLADGTTVDLLTFRIIATTVVEKDTSITLPVPVEIEKGSSIILRQTFTAGVSYSYGGISYYEID